MPVMTRRGERGICQRRCWEHTIRDDRDFAAHMDDTHFNPDPHPSLPACGGGLEEGRTQRIGRIRHFTVASGRLPVADGVVVASALQWNVSGRLVARQR